MLTGQQAVSVWNGLKVHLQVWESRQPIRQVLVVEAN